MTPADYQQLKAFARIDGALLALLWTMSFACYVIGLSNQFLGLIAIFLAIYTPFFVARRLLLFRNVVLGGAISFFRGWAFVILVFFYGGLLFALVQFIYLNYLDNGYIFSVFDESIKTPEFAAFAAQYGLSEAIEDMMAEFRQIRPIDFALHGLTTNITLGIVLGLPIAFFLQRKDRRSKNEEGSQL